MKELTYELTNYCPHKCKYCSSETVSSRQQAMFLPLETISQDLVTHGPFDRIVLSGGEPLAHPRFYDILMLCEQYADDVVVHSNAIKHLMYNANVIDGVYLEANLTVLEGVRQLHVLKRVEQGREAQRPEVSFSSNWQRSEACSCDHIVVRSDGSRGRPCRKKVD